MELGRRADYAVRAVLDLAAHPDERRKSRQIADAAQVPEGYLPQILAVLVRAGIVDSHAGREGGYRLARDAAAVSLLEVIEAVDGPIQSTQCVLRGGPCRLDGTCLVHDSWSEAQDAFRQVLAESSFADLLASGRRDRAT